MTAPNQFEEAVIAAVRDEVTAASPSLRNRGLTLGPLKIARGGDGNSYASELRLYVFRGGQICDALEVHMVRNRVPTNTLDELREWFRTQLQDLT